ncbi:MAG: M10 family metallopeptidase [Magnetococcales bacterium]|nr:M10 family metallopeptidase [Magnetococcales bacterium]
MLDLNDSVRRFTMGTHIESMPITSDGSWWADKPDATVQQYINVLDSGQSRASAMGIAKITYSIMDRPPDFGTTTEATGFTAFDSPQRGAVVSALKAWSDVANIQFVETSNLGGINFGASSTTEGGGTYTRTWVPDGTNITRSDVWLSTDWESNYNMGSGEYGLTTLTHELGHALGLNHAGNYEVRSGQSIETGRLFGNDDRQHSMMSYFQSPAYLNENLFPSSAMVMDIAAIQSIYGANTTTRTGDDIYNWPDRSAFISTIWDAGGTNTLDASNQTLPCILNLNAGSFSSIGSKLDGSPAVNNLGIAYGVTIDNAMAGSGGDTLVGNSNADVLRGGTGSDTLIAGSGKGLLVGGLGNDAYVFGADFGQDTVVDSGSNRLTFEDVDRSQLQFFRSQNDLIIRKSGTKSQVLVSSYYEAGNIYSLADNGGIFSFSLAAPVITSAMPETVAALPVADSGSHAYGSLAAVIGARSLEGMNSALITVRDRAGGSDPQGHHELAISADKIVSSRMKSLPPSAGYDLHDRGSPVAILASPMGANPIRQNGPLAGDALGVDSYSDHAIYSLSLPQSSARSSASVEGVLLPSSSLTYRDATASGVHALAMVEDPNLSATRRLGILVGKS